MYQVKITYRRMVTCIYSICAEQMWNIEHARAQNNENLTKGDIRFVF
jgi:hypothetical protein